MYYNYITIEIYYAGNDMCSILYAIYILYILSWRTVFQCVYIYFTDHMLCSFEAHWLQITTIKHYRWNNYRDHILSYAVNYMVEFTQR